MNMQRGDINLLCQQFKHTSRLDIRVFVQARISEFRNVVSPVLVDKQIYQLHNVNSQCDITVLRGVSISGELICAQYIQLRRMGSTDTFRSEN